MLYRSLFVAALLALVAPWGAAQFTLSQSLDSLTVTPGVSIACNTVGITGQNSWLRSYNLLSEGETDNILIQSVTFGIAEALAGGGAGTQQIEVRIYRDPTPGHPAPLVDLILIHSEALMVPDQSGTIVTHVLTSPVFVPNISLEDVVIEVFAPNGTPAGNRFYLGMNAGGQTAPTFWGAPQCSFVQPINLAFIGFVTSAVILDLDYVVAGPVAPLYPGTSEDFISEYSLNLAPGFVIVAGGTDVLPFGPGDYLEIRHRSPGGTFVGTGIGVFVAFGSFVTTSGTPGNVPSPIPNAYANIPTGFGIFGGGTGSGLPFELPSSGLAYAFAYPNMTLFSGFSMIVQAVINTPLSANHIYASTNAFEIQFL